MDLLVQNHLSDDQWALIACAAALILCGTVMSLSYFIGQARKPAQIQNTLRGIASDRHAKPIPTPGRKAA
jgi:hypothetical protein